MELWLLSLLKATRLTNLVHFDSAGHTLLASFSGSDTLLRIANELSQTLVFLLINETEHNVYENI